MLPHDTGIDVSLVSIGEKTCRLSLRLERLLSTFDLAANGSGCLSKELCVSCMAWESMLPPSPSTTSPRVDIISVLSLSLCSPEPVVSEFVTEIRQGCDELLLTLR